MAYRRVTLSTLQADLVERLGGNSTFWEADELKNAINEGLSVWHSMVGEWTESCSIQADGDNFYSVPSQVTSITRVRYNGTPLNMTSLYELDMGSPGWRGVTGTPYYWAPDGLNWFAVSPAPLSGSLQVDGYADSFQLQNSDSWVDLGDEELLRILEYAQWYLSFKEGVKEAVNNPETLMQHMMEAAGMRNARLRRSSLYREYMGRNREDSERATRYPVRKVGIRAFGQEGGQSE
jgi:hypothetical protein